MSSKTRFAKTIVLLGALVAVVFAVTSKDSALELYYRFQLDAPLPEERVAAARFLGERGSKASVPPLLDTLTKLSSIETGTLRESGDDALFAAAAKALRTLDQRLHLQPAAALIEALRDPSVEAQKRSTTVRGMLEHAPEGLGDALTVLLGRAKRRELETPRTSPSERPNAEEIAPETAKRFYAAIDAIPYEEQLAFAARTVESAEDPDVVGAALRRLTRLARQSGPQRSPDGATGPVSRGLEVVETYLRRVTTGSDLYQEAFLVKARLLYRLGKIRVAEPMFREAVLKDWRGRTNVDPVRAHVNALRENDLTGFAPARLRYATTHNSKDGLYLERPDFFKLFTFGFLWRSREKFSPLKELFPRFDRTIGPKYHIEIARALCLLLAERYTEAVQALRDVKAGLEPIPVDYDGNDPEQFFAHNEKRNISLYLAGVHLLEGKSWPFARKAMEDFVRSNRTRPSYVSSRLRELIQIARYQSDLRAQLEVAIFRAQLLLTDHVYAEALSLEQTFSTINRVATAFHRAGSTKTAKALCQPLAEHFDPTSDSAQHGASMLSQLLMREGDLKGAEETLLKLADDRTPGATRRWAKGQLARIWIDQGRNTRMLSRLVEDLRTAPPNEIGNYRSLIQRFENIRPAARDGKD